MVIMPKLREFFHRLKAKRKESQAIEKLLETTEILQKKSEFLSKRIEDEERFAVRNASINKRGAL